MVFNLKAVASPKMARNLIDIQEAFNIWDVLSTKYLGAQKFEIWQDFAHDPDLKVIINIYLKEFNKNIKILEKEVTNYNVRAPIANPQGFNTSVNSELFQDQYIAKDIFLLVNGHVENLLRSLRSTMTNDQLRKVFYNMAKETISKSDKIVKYLKLKGWIETPPLYHDTTNDIDEKLTTYEAYQLWNHLIFRYDNIRQTQIFESFAFDKDFKLMLQIGLKTIQRQAKTLEKELLYFGLPLPIKPSNLVVLPENTEILDDDFMYRTIFLGIQGAAIVHAQSLKGSTFNDRVRGIFKVLLLEEIDIQDDLIKFGKVKGWLHSAPSYRET